MERVGRRARRARCPAPRSRRRPTSGRGRTRLRRRSRCGLRRPRSSARSPRPGRRSGRSGRSRSATMVPASASPSPPPPRGARRSGHVGGAVVGGGGAAVAGGRWLVVVAAARRPRARARAANSVARSGRGQRGCRSMVVDTDRRRHRFTRCRLADARPRGRRGRPPSPSGTPGAADRGRRAARRRCFASWGVDAADQRLNDRGHASAPAIACADPTCWRPDPPPRLRAPGCP